MMMIVVSSQGHACYADDGDDDETADDGHAGDVHDDDVRLG